MTKKTTAGIDLSAMRQQLQEKVETELEKQLRAIPATVEHVVSSAILSIIGIRKDRNGYSVDTFGKREESLNGYIKRAVERKLEEIVGPFVEKELKRLLPRVTLPRSIVSDMHHSLKWDFERAFKDKLGGRFKELGKKFGETIADELDAAMVDVGSFNDDILDPKSFQGRIGKLFLEEIAEDVAAGESE